MPRRIVMVGCGASLKTMVAVRTLPEELLGVSCEPVQALDFAHYPAALADPDTLVISLGSSCSTTRTVAAVLAAKAWGANDGADQHAGTGLDHDLIVHAERKGWPTQSSIAAVALPAQLDFAPWWMYVFAAGGPCYGAAMLDAAKVPECTPGHALATPLEKYHHRRCCGTAA